MATFKAKFEQASLQHMDAIYTMAIRLTKSSTKAEELVQITYFRAYKSLKNLDDFSDFKTRVLSILEQTYLERLPQAASPLGAALSVCVG